MWRSMIIAFGLAFAGSAVAPAVRAQTIHGIGARPCSEWVQARSGGGRDFWAEQWVLGYLSGVNASGEGKDSGARQANLFSTGDDKSVFGSIDVYCRAHGQDMLWTAVKVLVSQRRAS